MQYAASGTLGSKLTLAGGALRRGGVYKRELQSCSGYRDKAVIHYWISSGCICGTEGFTSDH